MSAAVTCALAEALPPLVALVADRSAAVHVGPLVVLALAVVVVGAALVLARRPAEPGRLVGLGRLGRPGGLGGLWWPSRSGPSTGWRRPGPPGTRWPRRGSAAACSRLAGGLGSCDVTCATVTAPTQAIATAPPPSTMAPAAPMLAVRAASRVIRSFMGASRPAGSTLGAAARKAASSPPGRGAGWSASRRRSRSTPSTPRWVPVEPPSRSSKKSSAVAHLTPVIARRPPGDTPRGRCHPFGPSPRPRRPAGAAPRAPGAAGT